MTNTLVAPTDLADFPGAPFVDAVVDAVAGSLRDECGWHIAPEVTETLTVFSKGGTVLLVPSLKVSAVTAIRDVTGETPETLTGWADREAGILVRGIGWPTDHRIEVDLTHGHTECPPALLPVLAHRAQGAKAPTGNVRLGSLALGFSNPADSRTEQDEQIVARYRLR